MNNNRIKNPALYALYERAIREMLEMATTVRADQEGTRANGSTFIYTQELWPDEFDRIPWGKVDAIREAYWRPSGCTDRFRQSYSLDPASINVRLFMDVWDRGIGVDKHVLGHNEALLVGVKGTVNQYCNHREVIKCDSEDEAIAAIRGIIEDTFDAYRSETAYRADLDRYDFDESRYDPLDERNYPLDER